MFFFVIDSRDCLILLLLNAIIIPRMKVDTESKTATIKDGMECFSILVDCDANVKQKVSELEKKIKNSKQQFQPFIIVVGLDYDSINSFYIHFDNTLLKFNSFLSCVDISFKIFQVFNLQYPRQCYGSWLFIQKYFYDYITAFDKPVSKVLGLMSYLKNQE